MTLDSFFLFHASECRRRLRVFMAASARRRMAAERRAGSWRIVHAAEQEFWK